MICIKYIVIIRNRAPTRDKQDSFTGISPLPAKAQLSDYN